MGEGRSLAETPTWSVATVTTVMVAVCFVVERSIYRCGKWLKRTKRKALFASLEKIREELMLLGIISLMLGQTARWISEICVPSSLFTNRFYVCPEDDYQDHEPLVSYQGLEQLNRFLFLLGITHVSYSCVTAVLAMIKVYSWRKWENQTPVQPGGDLQGEQSWVSWPLWGYAIICMFVNIHGLNVYFWLSFIPAILVMLVGTKLQHVVAQLALEIVETTGPFVGTQLKPRDGLFWFRKPEFLLWLIHFISFQNAFEMATFIWSLWGLNMQSCLLKNHLLISIRLISGLLVQFWCSYSTLPLNVIVTQLGSKFKKALIAESVRESLHSWCKRVKEKSKRDSLNSHLTATRSVCSLESTIDERDETTTIDTVTSSESPSTSPRVSVSFNGDAADSANRLTLNGVSHAP
ncbi:MLO-like protein 4 [Acorus gramineus]|uniref:MLO-like protein n=1 Tax=Acorus gramineus TaxID=55184 RepID=A0AAV9BF34_ACOGR|nr:MLO-like protein 4 [Acorus gramineus]